MIGSVAVEGERRILLNVEAVKYVDTGGLGSLVWSYTTRDNSGGQVRLLHLDRHVREVMAIMKLLNLFEV